MHEHRDSKQTMTADPLDPEIRRFVDQLQRDWASHPPFMTLPLPEARAVAEKVRARWREGGPPMARTLDFDVPTATGPLRVRLLDPGTAAPAPALIYLHGGGFVLFSIDTHDRLMREYAAASGAIVLGVDYPLAPEARYPRALDQLVDLVDWLGAHGSELGVDPARIAIGGDSAGANLAIATALRLRDRGDRDRLCGLLLNYGGFSGTCSDEAEAINGGPEAVLNRAEMAYYFDAYLGPQEGAAPYAYPLEADLAGLPPAFLVIPDRDVLAEQSFAMAERLAEAGVDVESKVYAGATHSFLEAMSISRLARAAIADGAAWLKRVLVSSSG